MKKIICSSLALLALASCGTPKIETPEDALNKNQSSLIESMETLYKLTPEQAKSVGSINFSFDSQQWDANGSINYDFQSNQKTYESSGNLDMNINVSEKDLSLGWIWSFWANINLDLITLKDKFFFKLNTLNLSGTQENSQIDMMSGMVESFKEKWYFIENTMETQSEISKEDFLLKQKEIIALVKNHTILEHISTNENEDYYDYNVKISEDSIVSIISEFSELASTEESPNKLTEEELNDIRSEIQEFNERVKWNIRIDKDNLEYFVLVLSDEDWKLVIENDKENLNISHNNNFDWIFSNLKWVKSKWWFDAQIEIKQDNKIVFEGNLNLKSDWKKSEIKMDAVAKNEYSDDDLKINIIILDETNQQEVNIEEPKDSINLEEAITESTWMMINMH